MQVGNVGNEVPHAASGASEGVKNATKYPASVQQTNLALLPSHFPSS